MTAIASDTTLTALRQATAASHEAIDQQLHLGDDLPLERYVRILVGFESFLSAWEPAVHAALPASLRPWVSERSRLPFVRHDLQHFVAQGVAAGRAERRASGPRLPTLASSAAAFGSLYVVEGSALGGQVIARRVAERFGVDAGHGAAYFNGFGPRTGALWREFRERLSQEVGAAGVGEACAAAVATFGALATHFESVLSDEPVT